MASTDVNGVWSKTFEEAALERVQPSSRPSAPLVGGHPPDRAHQFDGRERALQDLTLAIWLSASGSDGRDPPLPRVGATRIRDQEVLGLLNAHRLIVDQDRHGLPPEAPLDREAEGVPPHLTILVYGPGALTEPEDALEAG